MDYSEAFDKENTGLKYHITNMALREIISAAAEWMRLPRRSYA